MLNYNLNTLYTSPRTIEPILSNSIYYIVVGGGAGASAGNGSLGGNGGQGGGTTQGIFDMSHLSTATIVVGAGGVSGTTLSAIGQPGVSSSFSYATTTYAINGGLPNYGTIAPGPMADGVLTNTPISSGYYLWGQSGGKGNNSSFPAGPIGIGGGNGGVSPTYPFGTPVISAQAPLDGTGGGCGGFRYNEFNGGGNINGAKGMVMFRLSDPRNVMDYVGDWDVFSYENGYKYFYWKNNGSFTLLGKKD